MTLLETPGNPMDQRLQNLMISAEQGRDAPVISVFAGGWIYRGQLTSYHWFLEYTRKHRFESLEFSKDWKKAGETERKEMAARAETIVDFMGPIGEPDLTALNLVFVTVVGATGVTIQVPAIRVPLAAVTSWSLLDFPLPKPPSSGGVAVGMAVPFGN